MSIFKRDKTFTQPIIWVPTLFMIAFHVGAIAALLHLAEAMMHGGDELALATLLASVR